MKKYLTIVAMGILFKRDIAFLINTIYHLWRPVIFFQPIALSVKLLSLILLAFHYILEPDELPLFRKKGYL